MTRLTSTLVCLLAAVIVSSLAGDETPLAEAYVARRDKAVRAAVADLLALGKWGREQKLFASARRAYDGVLLLSPEDAEAKQWLKAIDPNAPVQEAPKLVQQFETRLKDMVRRHGKALNDLAGWAEKAKLAAEAEDARVLARHLDVPSLVGLAADEKVCIDDVNRHRIAAGLVLAKVDRALSDGSKRHAEYLVRNSGHPSTQGLGAHEEDPKLAGYTPEGQRAGKSADICFRQAEGSVDGWVATLYHRIPVLHPRLRRIGVGFAQGGTWGWVGVLNLIEGYEDVPCDPPFVRYPARGQKDVPLAFGGEMPDPVPGGSGGCGYPVTLTFYDGSRITDVTAVLRDEKGGEVQGHLSTPEKPATSFAQQGTICLIPKSSLSGGTSYEAEFRFKRNGKDAIEKWTFRTR